MNCKKGFTLIEVIVAVLVSAMAVVAIFAVIVSTFTAAPKSDKKETAGLVLHEASERLKAYVTETADGTGEFPTSLPQNLCPTAAYEGTTRDPFQTGVTHNIGCLLENTVLSGGSLTYTVSIENPTEELQYKKVIFSLQLP